MKANTPYVFSTLGLQDKELLITNIVLKAFQGRIHYLESFDALAELDILLIDVEVISTDIHAFPEYTIVLGNSDLVDNVYAQLEKPLQSKRLLQVIRQILIEKDKQHHDIKQDIQFSQNNILSNNIRNVLFIK